MRRAAPKNPDCYVLVLAQEQRHYANYVMNRIRDVGLETDMMMVLDRSLPAEIHALVMRGIPFACVIGPKDEMGRTSSVSLLKRNPPEGMFGLQGSQVAPWLYACSLTLICSKPASL